MTLLASRSDRGTASVGGPPKSPVEKPRRVSFSAKLRRDKSLIIMVLPAVVLLAAFVYIPLLGNIIAFMDYVPFIPIEQSPLVGLANFEKLFGNPAFWNALSNTLQLTFMQLVLFFPVPIALALFINSLAIPFVRRFLQSVIYLPHFLSWVIVVAFFQQILGGSGAISQVLIQNGGSGLDIMTNPDVFKILMTSQVIWKDAGWGTIIFIAALAAIDESLYESAALDGAGVWHRFWHVTLPGIRPIIVLLLILRLGEALTVGFEQVLLQRDGVGPAAAEVLDTFVYFHGVVDGDWGVGAAAGLLKGVVGLVLVLLANKAAHLLGEQGVYSK